MDRTPAAVKALLAYGQKTGLITEDEYFYTANGIFHVLQYTPDGEFNVSGCEECLAEYASAVGSPADLEGASLYEKGHVLEAILKDLLDEAAERGLIDGGVVSRDLLDTAVMGCLTPRPK